MKREGTTALDAEVRKPGYAIRWSLCALDSDENGCNTLVGEPLARSLHTTLAKNQN
jgi:hypothetical protein